MFGKLRIILQVRFIRTFSSVIEQNCWKCNRHIKLLIDRATFTCPCREKVLLPPTTDNYYTIMDCNESYEVNQRSLRKKYHELQVLLHPDKYTLKSKQEQELAAQHSSLVNKAYNTIMDSYQRGLYLLELNGISINETDNMSDDIEFLEEIMSMNVRVDRSELTDQRQLNELYEQIKCHINNGVDYVSLAFSNDNISDAKNGLIRLKYFINLEQELKKKLTIS